MEIIFPKVTQLGNVHSNIFEGVNGLVTGGGADPSG